VPAVSVVMPVLNQLRFIDASVQSILGQSFRDFEFVILDDGSTDGSVERLRHWAARDDRIRLIENVECSGPVPSSNRVVAESRAPLIARMDGDDMAHPDRLRRQLMVLQERPDAILVGSLFDTVDASGRQLRPPDWPRLLRHSPLPPYAHSTILFRRAAFERVGGYRSEAARWEDVDLSRRMAESGPILVIPEALTSVRVSDLSSRLRADQSELDEAMDAMYRAVMDWPADSRRRLLPNSFVPVGSLHVWQGQKPRVLGRLLSRGAIGPDWASARVLIWSAWADFSPRTLRQALKWLAALRNGIARRRLRGAAAVAWLRPETLR
jgi:glycosyltransferase involved in cell wall biosynthesis